MKSSLAVENGCWVKSDYVSAQERCSLIRHQSLLWLTRIIKQFRTQHNESHQFVVDGDIVIGP